MQVYNKVTIDVKRKFNDIITAKQNDTKSRYLDVILVDNGVILDLTGHEVRIYGRKADGKEFYNEGIITDSKKGRCQFELTTQALALAQDLSVEIVVFKDNTEILSTLPFTIHVVKSLMSDNTVESSNEYGALVVLYQNLYEAYALMTEMVEKIGTPGEKAQELNLNTMFQVWDWLVEYQENNTTAGAMEKLNSIISSIGTSGDSGTDTVFGKINNGFKKYYSISSDNIKFKIIENQNLKITHTTGLGTYKKIYFDLFSQPLKSGSFKIRIKYKLKFEEAHETNNQCAFNFYDVGFVNSTNKHSFVGIYSNQPTGTITDSTDRDEPGISLGGKGIKATTTEEVSGFSDFTLFSIKNYIPSLILRISFNNTAKNGYVIIEDISICYDEVTE